ncbi:hypothetical protein J3E68DRAFT_397297 [Trichoderma sp. SZMC 28012]
MVAEFTSPHGSFGLPTVCCFIPSLTSGTPFQVSIHSWSSPIVSQFTRCYSKFGDSANFEARVFVDGQLVAYVLISLSMPFPHWHLATGYGFDWLILIFFIGLHL